MYEIRIFEYEGASCGLRMLSDHTAKVQDLFSKRRGKGHATGLMKDVVAYADQNQLRLVLDAFPYRVPGLTRDGLRRFYAKFGFELDPTDPEHRRMIRDSQRSLGIS